ncbi:polysaccharide biosynthesis tyrosine autokinase [Muricauda sp. HICW]|uniref:non-specific protein-tyrosine kinase n=1 Tax=Flagellimonas chongwuensis TaxID=2697365 RepID=A0A850NLP6_9FLAO|nr:MULTISPECIES: tyrosine-protein kinase [Allomuricauda]NVN19305.1 polysaccharide biosynthesis tyrosine autokinase [Allomuricauda chongwuensis]
MENKFSFKSIDFKEIIRQYTSKWYLFLLAVIFCLGIAFLYNRYTAPLYDAQARIKIEMEGNNNPELAVFQDLGAFQGQMNPIIDEIEIIKSRSNFVEVVKKLQLNTQIFRLGNILDSEIYKDSPFNLNFKESDSIVSQSGFSFYLNVMSDATFGYKRQEDEPYKQNTFGSNISTPLGDMIITPSVENIKIYKDNEFRIVIRPATVVADSYRGRVQITPLERSSNILSLYLQDRIQQRAQDIINALIAVYNENAIEDKKIAADKTSNFIDARITEIYSNLYSVDQSAEEFKTNRGITDISSESNINLSVGMENRQQLESASLQLNMASSMKDMVENQDGYEILPSNLGLSDQTITGTTARYNQLVAERNRLLESSSNLNPVVQNLDKELNTLKSSLLSSLNNTTGNLELQINSLARQQSRINSRIYSAPGNERELRDITRKLETTESLYLYLLEKREEAQIAFASASPPSSIVDAAYSTSSAPVAPNKMINYVAALFLGFVLPFMFIYVSGLLDNTLNSKQDLESVIGNNIPVIAELPKIGKKDRKIVKKDDRSVLAESLRILRTNLNYIQKSQKSKPDNLIFITSSVPGEGKTFISSNLAKIYADTGKKVLLVGADIRNPKLYDFFSSDENVEVGKNVQPRRSTKAGLTEFLVNSDLKVQDITVPAHINENEIDLIFSGKIPPNPTELLMNPRMGELFEKVSKMYDYVIVDTAPLMVVTDTLLISEYASQILYVVKAGATELKVIDFPLKLKEEGKLKGLSFVVNNVKQSELGYGGKYGYGYGKSVKKWWSFS